MLAKNKEAVISVVFIAWPFMMAIGYAQAGGSVVPSTGTFSGSFVNTESDTNGDGLKAGLFTGAGEDSVGGKFTAQSLTENFVSGERPCPNGNPGIELSLVPGTGSFVNRGEDGDLVYGEYVTQTQCFDPLTRPIFYTYTNRITGGTGRLEGATGTSEGEGIVTLLGRVCKLEPTGYTRR